MYPTLWEPFGFPISSFGVMMALGFLLGAWIMAVRLRDYGLDPEIASSMLLYAMIGGVVGSKLYFAVDVSIRTGAPFLELLVSRAGITWYGGLIGGTIGVALGSRFQGIPVRVTSSCIAIPAAVGQAIGRIGCFLVGDDYGRATDLPWGVAFPQGAPPTLDPVHPTQLYEMAWLFLVAAVLWRRRKQSPFLFGEYLMASGAGRFAVEELRVNPEVALGLTEPQWIGLALLASGAVGWLYLRGRPEPAAA